MRPRVALTNWRPHRKGQVRIRKGCDREWHSLSGDRIVRDKSGYGKNAIEQGALTLWRPHREREKSEDRVNATEQGALTSCRSHQVGQFRTREESDRARGTHILETPGRGKTQEIE